MDASNSDQRVRAHHATHVERRSDREIVVTRSFDAPARLVFEAWSRADLFQRWWVPRSMGMALRSCDLDMRTGGTYRLEFGNGMAFYGTYLEVTPPSRIVWTNDESGEFGSVTTVTLTEIDGATRVEVSDVFPSKEAFEAAGGAADALDEVFGQLDELLVELASQP